MHPQEHVVIYLLFCQLLFLIVSHGQLTTSTVQTSAISVSTGSSVTNSSLINDTSSSITMPTTSAVPTTTAKPTADVKHNTDIARYILVLSISQDNISDIRYTNTSLTKEDLQNKLSSFFPFSSGVSVDRDPPSGNYTLTVSFLLNKVTNASDILDNQIKDALRNMTRSPTEFFLPNENITFTKVDTFASSLGNLCAAANICPLGFSCNILGCQHMCASRDCSGHGTCFINVSPNATVTSMCKCDDEYANEYTGDNCEYSKRGRYQIIAIIAAVLGSACLVFIIIIIILCIWRGRGKSSANYNFTTASYHTNNAYDNSRDK